MHKTSFSQLKSKEVRVSVKELYTKYFDDSNEQLFAFGINPGTFCCGLTGIFFAYPVALRENCAIENNLRKQKELSSKFRKELLNFTENLYETFHIT